MSQNPEILPPLWVQSRRYPAHVDRQVIRTLRRFPGVQGPDDGRVTATVPPSMQVQVARLRSVIDGTVDDWQQGSYVANGPDDLLLDVPVSDSDLVTVHRVVAAVDDADWGGTGEHLDEVRQLIPGTPGQGPPALPLNAIPLATITVPAQASAVEQQMIVSERNLINPLMTLYSHTHLLWPWLADQPVPRDTEVLVQASNASFTTSALGAQTIYYPRPFPSGCCAVVVNRVVQTAPASYYPCTPFDFRADLFQVRVFNPGGTTTANNQPYMISYVALGW